MSDKPSGHPQASSGRDKAEVPHIEAVAVADEGGVVIQDKNNEDAYVLDVDGGVVEPLGEMV